MGDRAARRVAGAPFYAPPRRKTSAEIISEARAAVYGEMTAAANSASGALRALRTRRPFTPRDPQRSLFHDRDRARKGTRPPSAFDLKNLSLSENDEKILEVTNGLARVDDKHQEALHIETQSNTRKKPTLKNQSKSIPERGEGWGGFPRLPHLSGRTKPLHTRNPHASNTDVSKAELSELANAISVSRPLKGSDGDSIFTNVSAENQFNKSLSPENGTKRKLLYGTKSVSYDSAGDLGDISVTHITGPATISVSTTNYKSRSCLEMAEALTEARRDAERVVPLLDALQTALEKDVPGKTLRDMILRALYTHIDSEDERVLVGIARAMLTMRVTGSHLAAACKIVFKIARNDKNDHFFKNTNLLELLVEGCGRADPVAEGECCVYGAGALRVLALEPRLRALALRAGALHLAALHLKMLNHAKAENPRSVTEQSTHALYQLTGALRNLAGGGERDARAFVSSGALPELLAVLVHHTDRDVLTNVARCLSVLSVEESCCAWVCACAWGARAVCRALAACAARAPLAVRLAYTLGNMAATDQHARNNIYNEEGAVDVLLTILETYTTRNESDAKDQESDPDLHLVGSDLGGSDGSKEDVLIKTVRVIANLCLAERAGRGLATTHAARAVRALLACLELAGTDDEDPVSTQEELASVRERREELATAALATLNNITFYREPTEVDPPQDTDELFDKVCIVTCEWLRRGRGAGGEAVRALGNLSRCARAARLLVLHGALDHLEPFLQHEDSSVRCAASGVLVNVCGRERGGEAAALAARALGDAAGERDAAAGALLARALWNAHAHQPLRPHQAHAAARALASFIDDESVFESCEGARGSGRGAGERRASDTDIHKHHVKFNFGENEAKIESVVKAYSAEEDLNIDEDESWSGEDLGFEEGEVKEECGCLPCRRLADWEELVGVAVPLLQKLRPNRADASVGTD